MPPSAEPATQRFPCTPGGSVAAGRRRLALVLGGAAVGMALLAGGLLFASRTGPALIALAVGAVAWSGWRLGADPRPLWLEVEGARFRLQTRGERIELPLAGAAARRLDPDERRYLERLASTGGVVAGAGGFDSQRLGEFDLYASDLSHAVLVEADERRLVVTPDDPVALVAAIRRAAERPPPG